MILSRRKVMNRHGKRGRLRVKRDHSRQPKAAFVFSICFTKSLYITSRGIYLAELGQVNRIASIPMTITLGSCVHIVIVAYWRKVFYMRIFGADKRAFLSMS